MDALVSHHTVHRKSFHPRVCNGQRCPGRWDSTASILYFDRTFFEIVSSVLIVDNLSFFLIFSLSQSPGRYGLYSSIPTRINGCENAVPLNLYCTFSSVKCCTTALFTANSLVWSALQLRFVLQFLYCKVQYNCNLYCTFSSVNCSTTALRTALSLV